MQRPVRWKVVLVAPGEAEISLLELLSVRKDVQICGVVDPSGEALGTAIAEVMGLPIHRDFSARQLQQAAYLVHPSGAGKSARMAREAAVAGQSQAISSQEFLELLQGKPFLVQRAAALPDGFEKLELETAAIHRALSRIEEALQREPLLRWLLSLATRAAGATSGSIMLCDEKTDELYIAYAYGLSEATLHRTRVMMGEGIAGRVALQRQSELVRGLQPHRESADQRDRPDIASSICAPLIWQDTLLGVLNVSTAGADPPLDERSLQRVDHLARRLSLILHRFHGIHRAASTELFQRIDRELQGLEEKTEELPTLLCAWAGTLALALNAERMALAVVCDDGSFLVAEGREGGDTSSWYEGAENAAWQEVLATGRPLVARQTVPEPQPGAGLTAYHLPVGAAPSCAVASIVFRTAADAYAFHELSGEMLHMLGRRLGDLVARVGQEDRLRRMTDLCNELSHVREAARNEPAAARQRLLAAARRLTGARQGAIVTEVQGESVDLSDMDPSLDAELIRHAGRLLQEASEQGYRVTLLSESSGPRAQETSLLAVPAQDAVPAPGLLLCAKQRRHPLDGTVFTRFDAELTRHLARQLLAVAAKNGPLDPVPAVLVEAADEGQAANGATGRLARTRQKILLDMLRREMDRSDRYHTTFAVVAFRPHASAHWDEGAARRVIDQLDARMRSSDFLTCLEDGTLLMVIPEEVQALARLQRRVAEMLREITGLAALPILTGSALYPGRNQTPEEMLASALEALSPDS